VSRDVSGERHLPVVVKHKPVGTMAKARWHAVVYWHRLRAQSRSWLWWVRNAVALGFWVALGWPVYQKSITYGVVHTLFALAVLGGRAVRFASPVNMQLVKGEYLSRKNMLYRLLKEMQYRDLKTSEEIWRFQHEALQLIVSYVRSHRADAGGTEIFANLLIESGDELVVLARDKDHRLPGARYPKEGMLAWQAIRFGEVAYTGDVVRDLGQSWAGKPYRSIMVLPIRDDERILGAVSIDSARRHHFDLEWSDLERYLAPYVCLLGWTLKAEGAMFRVVSQK
jgi:hypothetical protein